MNKVYENKVNTYEERYSQCSGFVNVVNLLTCNVFWDINLDIKLLRRHNETWINGSFLRFIIIVI